MNGAGVAYCRGRFKRAFDLTCALAGLVLAAPLFVLISVTLRLVSGPPVFFSQDRVGRDGRPFRIHKFRTMRAGSPGDLQITGSGDSRVTPLGGWLRASKLDELPQLVNIVRGEMSLVGPRPEVAPYVDHYTAQQRRVLLARPGLTDPATLQFRDEEDLLGEVPLEEQERYYLTTILPHKLSLNLAYLERATFRYDLALILRTLGAIVRPARPAVSRIPPDLLK